MRIRVNVFLRSSELLDDELGLRQLPVRVGFVVGLGGVHRSLPLLSLSTVTFLFGVNFVACFSTIVLSDAWVTVVPVAASIGCSISALCLGW